MIPNIAVNSHQDVGKYCVSNQGLLVFCQGFFNDVCQYLCADKRQFFRSLPDIYEHHCTQPILLVLQVSRTHVSFN